MIKSIPSLCESAAEETAKATSRTSPSKVTEMFKNKHLIDCFDDFLETVKTLLDDEAFQYIRTAMEGDADDLAFLKKVSELIEKGSESIGRNLSKAELEAGLKALWSEGGMEGALAAIERVFRKIKPRNTYNADAKPSGIAKKITDKMDAETRRSLMRENDAAETIARNGYNIKQSPVVEGTSRLPDYRIEGEIFDCYSPTKNTNVRNIAKTIEDKVLEKKQANRIVINLDDWMGEINNLIKQLKEYPIDKLEEVLIVKEGKVISIYP